MMGKLTPINSGELTTEQLTLVKSTIAKGATNEELQLFLYRCKTLGLDPLKPGQIYFVKYGTSPGTIVIGVDGFRSQASKTGKHAGTQRGVLRDESGKCIGAWCEVYRSDWTKPAREEVSLSEYNTGKGQWSKMPETMIKKVAEVAALRMAFPDELGGLYSDDEMAQADNQAGMQKAKDVQAKISQLPQPEPVVDVIDEVEEVRDLGDFEITFGKKYKGKKLKDISAIDLGSYVDWLIQQDSKNQLVQEMIDIATAYLETK